MKLPIHFHNKIHSVAHKVRNVRSDWNLSSETEPNGLTTQA